ncbi:MAG TPA: peptidase domain-containing ABC transporter [Kofleriaceae bacterium]|nr:peptidase domain-containing ABC transporter [Kofleriaceae bacterium]
MSRARDPEQLPERVPWAVLASLRRLGRRRSRCIPYVPQLESSDCGAACLVMAAAYHGRTISLDKARTITGVNRGSDALSLLEGARQLGLRGRGVRIDIGDLRHLKRATILHWTFNHFVVFERVRTKHIDILDPAYGRRTIPIDVFRKHFTGIALELEPSETFAPTPPQRSKVWRYLGHLLSQHRIVARVLVTSLLLRLLALALPILTALIVDRVVPREDYGVLLVVGGGVTGVLALHVLATLIRAYSMIDLRTHLDTKMTLGFLSHLLSLPQSFFHRRSTGDLLLRVSSNTQIRDLLTSGLLATLLDGLFAVGYLGLLLLMSRTLALVTLVVASLQLLVLLLARRTYAQLTAQDLESQARASSYLVQMLSGIETIKVAGAEDRALAQWSNLYVDELNVSLASSRLMALVDAASSLLHAASPLILLGAGTLLVLDGSVSLGVMLATMALATGLLTPLGSLFSSALQLQMLGSYVNRIDDVLAMQPEQRPGGIVPARLSGAVELKQVSFRYGPNDPFVVQDVSLRIEPGSTVAIVGRSGSGKSTLASLLLGLHQPAEGRIMYDAYDVTELDCRALRRQFGVVPQAPFIFSGSIRSNIALADPTAPFERVVAAARRADIDDEIRALGMGYETIVADGGASLSGGQRQRLALARALLDDPVLLLLDEATSSLDATTERAVMESLRSLRATRIVIAHRLSTIAHADQIVVMHQGRIVEMGRHAELVVAGGVYAALIADQAFGERPR